MKVFISWAGELSKQVAKLLSSWLEDVLQGTKAWISTDDINKGSLWFSDLTGELADTSIGILCLTRDNITAPWILFEAGALSKGLTQSRVCPFLINLRATDLTPPLSQFNGTFPTKEDMRALVKTINAHSGNDKRPEEKVDRAFDRWWDDWEPGFRNVVDNYIPAVPIQRPLDDVIVEILEMSRSIQMNVQQGMSKLDAKLGTKKLPEVILEQYLTILSNIQDLQTGIDKKVTKVDQEVESLKYEERGMEDVLLGAFLSKHQKHEEALQHLDRAIQRSPQNAYARIQKGFVLKRLGQIKDAYDIVNNLVMEQPQNQTAWYNRACYGVILGYDKKQVFSDLRRAISLFPPYREFSKRDPDFEDIRNDEGFLTIVSGGNRASDTTKDGSAY